MTTQTEEKIHVGQIQDIWFSDIKNTPTTLEGYGITDGMSVALADSRYVRYDVDQALTPEQQSRARLNIGVTGVDLSHSHLVGDGSGTQFTFAINEGFNVIPGNNTTVAFNPSTKSFRIDAPAPTPAYIHPTQSPIDLTLSGKQSLSRIIVNNLGHFVGYEIRSDLPYIDLTSTETITGLKTIQRAGPNDGSAQQEVLGFGIGSDGLYKMMIRNSINEQAPAGEVNWFFTMRENYQSSGVDFDHIGIYRGGTTVLGDRLPSQAMSTEISTFTNAAVTAEPYPISTFVARSMMVENRVYAGKSDLDNTLFLSTTDRIYSSGRVYAALGLRTTDPVDYNNLNQVTWLLGKAVTSSTSTVDRYVEVNIDGVVYELLARQKAGTPPGPPPSPGITTTSLQWLFSRTVVTGSISIQYYELGVLKTVNNSSASAGGSILVDEGTHVLITVNNSGPTPATELRVETLTPVGATIYYRNSPPSASEVYDLYVGTDITYKVTGFISQDDSV